MLGFEGVFFPGESFDTDLEDSILKKSLFYFDKIYALVPEPFNTNLQSFVREYKWRYYRQELNDFDKRLKMFQQLELERIQGTGLELPKGFLERQKRIINFLVKTESLREEGVLEIIDPRENIVSEPHYWDKDVEPISAWSCIKDKFESLSDREIGFHDIVKYTPHFLYGSILDDLKDKNARRIIGRKFWFKRVPMYKGQAEANWMEAIGEQSGFRADIPKRLRGFNDMEAFQYSISPQMWASLLINHALISSFRKKAVPVCSNPTFQALMDRKIERCYKKFTNLDVQIPNFKKDLTTFRVALENLPDLELRSFEDVLEMRERLRDDISAFRQKMTEFAETVKAEPYSKGFENHVEIIKRDKIRPSVDDLRKKLSSVDLRTAVKIPIATAITLYLVVNPSLPPALAILACPDLLSLTKIFEDYRREYKQISEKNGFSLLIKINNA